MKTKNNPMRAIRIEKVTLNMGAGEAGPKLDRSAKVLEKITGRKPVITKTHKRSTFGVAKGKTIGTKITLRGKEARSILEKLLQAVEYRLKPTQFDSSGNFSFGVHEYINIPGVSYDPEIGIMGLDVAVTLERPGFRIKRRRLNSGRIGKQHRITAEEAREFAQRQLGVKIIEEE